MSKGQKLRALVNERLTAAAEEIFELFERTIAEYEEEVHRFKQRNNTQQQLLDQVLEPRVLLHRTGGQTVTVKSEEEVGPSPEPPHIKEEPEEEQLQEFPFPPVSVKSEDDEDKSSVLHQRTTKNREETNGEDCGAEAGSSSDPLTHLHSDSEHTDHSDDWTQTQTSLKRSSSVINRDSSERAAGENSKQHKCSECGQRFQKDYLKTHMLTHTGGKPFKCSVCQKEFTRICNLKLHMSIHTGEKLFRCSICQREFTRISNLKLHMRIHTGERPFSCSVCKKIFRDRGGLNRHIRVHTGERPFSCSVCKKIFRDRGGLNRHVIIHTGERPFICSVCKKGFTQKLLLYRHLKTHTGAGALSSEQEMSERGGAKTAGGAC